MKMKKLALFSTILFCIFYISAWLISVFFNKFELRFQSPIQFQYPILIQERSQELVSPLVSVAKAESVVVTMPTDPIELEIYEVFGEEEYKSALKIFTCESGLRTNAVGKNSNGSFDAGIPQINSVHGIRQKWLKNPAIAIRVAKQLFDEQGGFGAWYSSYECHGVK